MNAGIIASRYAKAFLKYVQEEGTGEAVYSQVCTLVELMNELGQMREYIENVSDISVARKIDLLSAGLQAPLEGAVAKFLKMVAAHRRTEYFSRMLLLFIEQYRQANDIKVGRIVTATGIDGLGDRLSGLIHDRTGSDVHLQETVNPELLGGFIFELDGYRLDASVEGHLARIRRQLVEKNNRIV